MTDTIPLEDDYVSKQPSLLLWLYLFFEQGKLTLQDTKNNNIYTNNDTNRSVTQLKHIIV